MNCGALFNIQSTVAASFAPFENYQQKKKMKQNAKMLEQYIFLRKVRTKYKIDEKTDRLGTRINIVEESVYTVFLLGKNTILENTKL